MPLRLPLLVPLLFALSVGAFAAEPLSLQAPQLKVLGVETADVAEAAGSGRLPARVTVPNAQKRIVAAPVAGLVAQLAVAPGTAVRRGQPLAELASPQALELQRDALQAGSQSALAQQNLKRDEALYAEGLIAESRLQASRAAAAQAGAAADQGRRSLALAGLVPGKMGSVLPLTAPIDGVVLEQNVQLGQRVEVSTPLYTIARLAPLWLEIQVPQEFAAMLRVGMAVRVSGSAVAGKLIAIGRAVDAASQTILLRAEVAAGAETLRPGQVCEVELAAGSGGRRLPAAALARIDGQPVVFVQTAADAKGAEFAIKPVRILSQGGDSVSVDGLAAGERVVVRGVSGLKAIATGVGRE